MQLQWYGVLMALAVLAVYLISEKRVRRIGISADQFSRLAMTTLLFGFVGARLWHVATDWQLYQEQVLAILYIWRGGMSIFGGLLGGALGLWWAYCRLPSKHVKFLQLSDSIVLALPIGQAIGRLGNWVNQELYGLPTNLPWGIYISPDHRLPGFEQFSYYHPLFAYEAIALLFFTAVLWFQQKNSKSWNVGTGKVTYIYILFYAVLRITLDFIRPDKQLFSSTGLGVNQAILIGLVVFLLCQKMTKRAA